MSAIFTSLFSIGVCRRGTFIARKGNAHITLRKRESVQGERLAIVDATTPEGRGHHALHRVAHSGNGAE